MTQRGEHVGIPFTGGIARTIRIPVKPLFSNADDPACFTVNRRVAGLARRSLWRRRVRIQPEEPFFMVYSGHMGTKTSILCTQRPVTRIELPHDQLTAGDENIQHYDKCRSV